MSVARLAGVGALVLVLAGCSGTPEDNPTAERSPSPSLSSNDSRSGMAATGHSVEE